MKIKVKQMWKRFQTNYGKHLYITVFKCGGNDVGATGLHPPNYKQLPDTWEDDYRKWRMGKVTARQLCAKYDISQGTLFNRAKQMRNTLAHSNNELWVYVYESKTDRVPSKVKPVKKIKCGERKAGETFYYDECIGSIIYAIHEMNGLPIPDIDYGFCEFVWDSSIIDGYGGIKKVNP